MLFHWHTIKTHSSLCCLQLWVNSIIYIGLVCNGATVLGMQDICNTQSQNIYPCLRLNTTPYVSEIPENSQCHWMCLVLVIQGMKQLLETESTVLDDKTFSVVLTGQK